MKGFEILKPGFLGPMIGMPLYGYSGGQTYAEKVLATQPANLIGYWPLAEDSGTNADNAEGTAARDGTFARNVTAMGTSTGIGDGNTAPDFDGVNDYCDIYSASLAGAFNGAEGTAAAWVKVSGAGVWTDAASRLFIQLTSSGTNTITLKKDNSNNRLELNYGAGGVFENNQMDGILTTGWMYIAMTWSATDDAVKYYYNGAPEGATDTILGVWAGALAADKVAIGVAGTAPPGATPWDGNIAHVAIWTTPLSATQIADLYVPT